MRGISLMCLWALVTGCKDRSNGSMVMSQQNESNARLVVIALNDVHGSFDPTLVTIGKSGGAQQTVNAGGLDNLDSYLQVLRSKYGEQLLILDAGDIYQGTLFSNYFQGRSMVAAYNALGIDAVAVGNHEFDYGPLKMRESERATLFHSRIVAQDRIGSFLALVDLAKFKVLAANIRRSGRPFAEAQATGVLPSTMITRAGRKIGIIGATTITTSESGNKENLTDLDFSKIGPIAVDEAQRLRRLGADAIILLTHAGGVCHMNMPAADGDKACASPMKDEITEVLETAPKGTFDLVVAGHMHSPQAHFIRGTPVLQNYDGALSFARADLVFDGLTIKSEVKEHTYLCESHFKNYPSCNPKREGEGLTYPADLGHKIPPVYLGETVVKKSRITQVVASFRREVDQVLNEAVTQLPHPLEWNRLAESPMGNCYADVMKLEVGQLVAAHKIVGVTTLDGAMFSSGGIRKGLPANVTYGNVYAVAPFDGDGMVVVDVPTKYVSALARKLGPSPKVILVVSDGWKSLVGPAGDFISRGAVAPAFLEQSSDGRVRILAFEYFVGTQAELVASLQARPDEIKIFAVPGDTRDHLNAGLRLSPLPPSCTSPSKDLVRTQR